MSQSHRFMPGGPAYTGKGSGANGGDGGLPAIRVQLPWAGPLSDASGQLTTALQSRVVLAQDSRRKYLLIQNLTAGSVLWLNFGDVATAGFGSFMLTTGSSMVFEGLFIVTQALNVLATVVPCAYTCKVG